MALAQSISFLTLYKHQFIGTSKNRRTLVLSTTETPGHRLISLFHTACSPLRAINSDDGTREESPLSTSISSVFVKGLPDSVNEGRLKKVFSEFGQVSNVKIIINERTRKSLGYGYIWFNSQEDAQLAVETMNGKILLTEACSLIPGLSNTDKKNSKALENGHQNPL